MRQRTQVGILIGAVVVAIAVTGREGVKIMQHAWVFGALQAAEMSGQMEGMEFEHFVGGGLPPPYLRSEQLRVMTKDGRDVIWFSQVNFKIRWVPGVPFARDVYEMPATREDVQLVARLFREPFLTCEPSQFDPKSEYDVVRTELVVKASGKEATRVYRGGAPPELAALTSAADALIARVKAQGVHSIKQ
jgi:hypothetical protein